MAEDVKNYKKFVIQRIINPGVYWMTEYEKEKLKRETILLRSLLAENVDKVKEHEHVTVGYVSETCLILHKIRPELCSSEVHREYLLCILLNRFCNMSAESEIMKMVAVKNKTFFYRGVVTDFFNRKTEIMYCVLLVDYGRIVETTKKHLYFIKSKELRNKHFNAFEVTIQDIQPFVLDVNYKNNFESGIFQKRVCNTWSATAFKFVKDLMKKNPYVYVKALNLNKWRVCGEIYVVEDSHKQPVSLGQLLCDKGFSVSSNIKTSFEGEAITCIEDKIPKKALVKDNKKSFILKLQQDKRESEKITNSETKQGACEGQSGALKSSTLTLFESETASNKTSPEANEVCFSPSWMLKKCSLLNGSTLSSAHDPLEKHSIFEFQESETNFPKQSTTNVFQLIQKSMKLFNKQKNSVTGYGPN